MYTIKVISIELNELNDPELLTCKKHNAKNIKAGSINVFSYSTSELEAILKDMNNLIAKYKKYYQEYQITIHKDNVILFDTSSDYFTDSYNNLFSTKIDSIGNFE